MVCIPPFYPSPGHESTHAQDQASACAYYGVWRGRVRGTYTNSWIARELTDGFTDSRQKSFKTIADLQTWWAGILNRPTQTHPTSPACTLVAPNYLPPVQHYVAPPAPPAPAAPVASTSTAPIPAPSPFNSSTSSATSSSSTIHPRKKEEAASPELSSPSPPPGLHLNVPPRPHLTPSTRLHLTPTGAARAANLQAAAATHAEAVAPVRRLPLGRRMLSVLLLRLLTPPPPPPFLFPPPVAGDATPRAGAVHSILLTPAPAATPEAAPPLAVAPVADAEEEPVWQYAVRGVGVFYQTYAAARAAARQLGVQGDSKILMSSNVAKLEAWMRGTPFAGDGSS
ncbi:hypothetical protein B0H16DRAFT_1734038 [Mycena metata]|uniref:Ribonuclease H1 N-terminal domain-containing protein n=1 Tax=Mycena metata TaxID=1033252 RepID=A0AAD7MSA4_9AGAR|nr:hypothetical protein B0H16DRAFT_1734038 [Mycena metata]